MKKLFKITSLFFVLMIFITSCETKPDAMQVDAKKVCDLNKKGDTLTDIEFQEKAAIEASYKAKAEEFAKAVEVACSFDVGYELTDVNLEVLDFDEFKQYLQFDDNKIYVINFWATWCAPCIKELPYFEKINKDYKKLGVEVILVSLDFPSQFESRLKPFIIENKIDSRIIVLDDKDMNTWIPAIDKDWDGAIPATIIYNKNLRAFYPKAFTFHELEKEVNNFINLQNE